MNAIEKAYEILKENNVTWPVTIKVTATAKGLKVSMGDGQKGIQFYHFNLDEAIKIASIRRYNDLSNMAFNLKQHNHTSPDVIKRYETEAGCMRQLSHLLIK